MVPNEDHKSIDGWRPELKLINRSQKDSGALKLHVQSGTYESLVDIGGLRPNEERLVKLPNSVAVNRKAHRCLVSFEIKNGCGHIQGALDHLMNCVHQPSPQIASRIVFSDKTEGNHDGVLQFGEHAELNTTIRVSHINAPLELDVAVQLDGPTHERFIRLHEGHFERSWTVRPLLKQSGQHGPREKFLIQDRRQNQQRSATFHDPSRKADCD